MNVYDFDGTIYDGDSTIDFWTFCLKKRKRIIFLLPMQIIAFILYKLRLIKKLRFKELFYTFLRYMDNSENLVSSFWDINEKKVKVWYIEIKKENDLVITASPYFLIKEICERLGILEPIASNVSIISGKYTGENCYGKEKVRLFREKYPNVSIDNFYSDSKSDLPLAQISKTSYFVKKNTISDWSIQ